MDHIKQITAFFIIVCLSVLHSCAKEPSLYCDLSVEVKDTISVDPVPFNNLASGKIIVKKYAPLSFSHQSAASYGDYVFFVTRGRSSICLYNLKKKTSLYVLKMKGLGQMTYHCNQSSFGIERFDPSDPFPLLYISQNAKADKRCFLEVFRILPIYDEELEDYSSFSVDLVQTIFFPAMSADNSLGNVNCAIDTDKCVMYTYSRNNNPEDDNYGQCKVSKFHIPIVQEGNVYLEDDDILTSFFVDCKAFNMQGGFIKDDTLFVGQGSFSVGYIFLNIIDLKGEKLIRRIDLKKNVSWEPEGCFFYDGSVMISHTAAISTIE